MKYKIHQIATRPLLLAFVLGLSFFLVLTAKGQGRAPAVLNEKGISIEERRQTPPEEAKEFGYNFDKNNTDARAVAEGINRQAKLEASSVMVAISLFILSLPLMVWFGMMAQLKREKNILKNSANNNQDGEQKPVSLDEFRSKQKDAKETTSNHDNNDGNNRNFPKAS